MALFRSRRGLDDDLRMAGPTLGDAIDRFARAIVKVRPRTTTRAANLAAHFPRLRPARRGWPMRLPLLRGEKPRSGAPQNGHTGPALLRPRRRLGGTRR